MFNKGDRVRTIVDLHFGKAGLYGTIVGPMSYYGLFTVHFDYGPTDQPVYPMDLELVNPVLTPGIIRASATNTTSTDESLKGALSILKEYYNDDRVCPIIKKPSECECGQKGVDWAKHSHYCPLND